MGQSNGEHNQFAEIHFLSGRTSTMPAYGRVRKRSFCNKKDISAEMPWLAVWAGSRRTRIRRIHDVM